ncbi:MAG TPA: Calx-beta domain-containing protein [Kiritimatiellia bacterium]|nr:Calx-beta domain-containing protein [Kiritimatiellia bacterium]HMO98889.1 Calx-beta domain-containing protein [Kiritimatiellia bacterium]HMP96251.1 Calx-beta domain-containing protein [Kiritimatiellia bacterium]
MNTRHCEPFNRRAIIARCLPALLLLGALLTPSTARAISEPHTVFYGKVLGTASAQPFLITTGRLEWTMQRSDGQSVTLQTSLFPLNNGMYSYRLNVPHGAFALGLDDPGGIPLPPTPQVNIHAAIKVDGQTAALLGPAGVAFTTEQLLRTATYRLDLGLNRTAVDTDGDGIPDWWEDQFGLDKQDPSDAQRDFSGDGLSALQAYLQGLDPTQDARHPALLTEEIIVYPSGLTAVLLHTADLDSAPGQLTYTVTGLPPSGSLILRNAVADPDNPDRILAEGSSFSQADVLAGRVVYEHQAGGGDPGFFGVSVRDENPAHPANEGTVSLLAFEPADYLPAQLSPGEAQRLDNHFYAGMGYVVLDAASVSAIREVGAPSAGLSGSALDAYRAAYGDDLPYVVVASSTSNAVVKGGHRGDVLIGGGRGDAMTGGPGADLFVVTSFDRGSTTITDYTPASGDVLDLSLLPAPAGAYVHHVIRMVKTAGVHRIQIDRDGDGVGFTNRVVMLPGLPDAQANLYDLIESGKLLVGDLQLEPMISVAASQPQASENGPTEGRFTLTRRGSLAGDLTVNIGISGSAINGTDYITIPNTVVMPEGVATVDVPVAPYADGQTENTETVQLTITAGAGYRIGTPSSAIVTIEDLLMLVEIEALEPIAVKDEGSPGLFLITRRDVINRDVLVRLTISGTASNGVDYNRLTNQVYMAANQTAAFLYVMPRPTAQLAGGLETVVITVRPDANYRVAGAGSAQVLIIERNDSFAGWRAREFPEASGDAQTFAIGDSGNTGVTHFERYAFGLDPHQPDLSGLPKPLVLDGKLGVTFRRPAGISDVEYRVTASRDLPRWTEQSAPVVPVVPEGVGVDPARVYYRAEHDDPVSFIAVEAEWMP